MEEKEHRQHGNEAGEVIAVEMTAGDNEPDIPPAFRIEEIVQCAVSLICLCKDFHSFLAYRFKSAKRYGLE
jgi:hypothetical protein